MAYTYAIIAGGLPPGLTLDEASGLISGTPTTAGDYPFTVQVTDSLDATATNDCEIDITSVALICTDYYTLPLADAIDELAARLDDPLFVHWTQAELSRYLVEALRTYSAFTQRYRDRASFATVSGQPFYDLPTELPTLRGYHVTDRDLVTDIEYALMEPPTPTAWTGTSQFTLPLIVECLQSRLNQFLEETGGVLTRSLTGLTPDANGRIMLPANVITIRRAAWRMNDGTVVPLKREDEWTMQHFAPAWPQNPQAPSRRWPTGYSVGVTPPLVVQLAPAPETGGLLDLVAVVTAATLDPANLSTLLGVPDDWSWVIKWGALSELLNRDGLAYDPQRAAYCEARYRQGVKLAKAASVVLQGYIDGEQGSLKSLVETDQYRRSWQTTPGAPTSILTAGWNLVGCNPPPNGTGYTITLDMVVNVPIPVSLIDCVPIDAFQRDCWMDYAQHLSTFKEGPSQLLNTMNLFDNFMRCTNITVALDMAAVPDRPALFDQTLQDEKVKRREEPPDVN